MSLEEAMRENTAAVKELTKFLAGKIDKIAPEQPTKPAAKEAVKPAAKPAPEVKTDGKIDYTKDVKPLVLSLAGKSRDAALSVLGEFGVSNGLHLKPEQYGDFIKKANAKIAELSA